MRRLTGIPGILMVVLAVPCAAQVNYDTVLLSTTKDGNDKVAQLKAGAWADVKVKIVGGASEGLTAGFLVKVETLAKDLSQVRLYHTSVTRANATWRDRTVAGNDEGNVGIAVATDAALIVPVAHGAARLGPRAGGGGRGGGGGAGGGGGVVAADRRGGP